MMADLFPVEMLNVFGPNVSTVRKFPSFALATSLTLILGRLDRLATSA